MTESARKWDGELSDGGHTDAPNNKYFILWASKFLKYEWKGVTSKEHELGNHTLYHPCIGGKGREWVSQENDLNNYTEKTMVDETSMTNLFLNALDQ